MAATIALKEQTKNRMNFETGLKDPMQYELFYEIVGCVGSFIVCNLLLRWAFIVLSELDRNGTQKNKSAKNNNIIS